MKFKKLSIGALLIAGTLILGSCVKNKKVNPTDTGTTPATTDVTTTGGNPTTSLPTDPVTTPEPTLPPQTSVTIDPIDDTSLLNRVYEDFNKPTLPKTYVAFVKEVFASSLQFDAEAQKAKMSDIDCLSAKGIAIVEGEEVPFLMDSAAKLSTDEAYIGHVLTPIIVNPAEYIDDLLEYEESLYGEIATPSYYVYQNKDERIFIISIESKDGSNRDLIIINSEGVGSYINYSDYDYKFETVLEAKGKLTSSDLAILNNQPYIRYNNDGCQYKIMDFDVSELTIPGSYRTIPFNDLDLNDLDKCENLESISLNGSNKYKVIDGVLYNKELTSLLYYPKAKTNESFTVFESVTSIRKGAFKNLKNLKELTFSTGIDTISDYEFEGSNIETINLNDSITTIGTEIFKDCENLKNITLPFSRNGSLLDFFQTEKNDNLNEVIDGDNTYYVPNIESLNLLTGTINEKTFLGIDSSIKNIQLSTEVTALDTTNFVGAFDNLETIIASGVTSVSAGLFKDKAALKEVDMNLSIVGEETFSGCTSLESITSNSFTEIGASAFKGCENITTIDSSNLTKLGANAFEGCKLLETINCEKVTSLGSFVFKDCKKITSLSFPLLTSLPENAFESCSIESLSVPNVTTVGERVFYGCSKLNSISISKLKTLSEYAFYNCVALPSLNIPLVTKVPASALYQCSLLSSLTTGTITSVGTYGLAYCKALPKLDLSKVTSLGTYAFYYCKNFHGDIDLNSYLGNGGDKKLPVAVFENCDNIENVYISSSITSIASYAFYGCSSLKYVNIMNVTSFGEYSFAYCKALNNINFSSSRISFDNGAFYHCEGLTSLNVLASKLGTFSFAYCNSIKTVTIDVSGDIKDRAFANMTSLETFKSTNTTTKFPSDFFKDYNYTSVTMPLKYVEIASTSQTSSLFQYVNVPEGAEIHLGLTSHSSYNDTDIKKFSYVYLDSLTSNTINTFNFDKTVLKGLSANSSTYMPAFKDNKVIEWVSFNNITTIAQGGFSGCTSLKNASFASLTSIGQSAFSGCTSLESFDFGKCTNCGNYGAFSGCTSLKSVTGSKVTSVGQAVFYGCSSLKTIGFMANITSISCSSFTGCSSLESFSNSKLTEIYGGAFENCTKLKTVSFSGVTYIYAHAFKGCSALSSVYIPGAVTVGGEAFYKCTSLTSIELTKAKNFKATDGAGNTEYASSHFEGCTKLTTVNLSSATTLANSMFKDCTSLTTITTNVVTSFGTYSFYNCTSLIKITNSSSTATSNHFDFSSVTTVPQYAFYNCKSLTYIKLGSVTSYGNYSFYKCEALSTCSPTTTMNVETVGEYAFYGCKKISSQTFGSIRGAAIKTIGAHSFEGTALWNIEFSDSVTSVGTDAFANLVYINSNITGQTVRVHYSSATASLVSSITTTSLGGVFKNNVTYFYVDAFNTQYSASTINNIYYGSSLLYSYYYIDKAASSSADLMQLIVKPN